MSDAIQQQEKIDQGVMDTLRERDHSALAQQVNPLRCTHNDIVELLAHYMALSEQDNDELFDDWFDNLSKEQHTVLKVFEVYRGQYEHQN
jgi:cytidylate kinase